MNESWAIFLIPEAREPTCYDVVLEDDVLLLVEPHRALPSLHLDVVFAVVRAGVQRQRHQVAPEGDVGAVGHQQAWGGMGRIEEMGRRIGNLTTDYLLLTYI